MKKLALLSMLLGLTTFVVGCGETKTPPPKAPPPGVGSGAPMQNPPVDETTSPPKEGEDMTKEVTEPADGVKDPAADEVKDPAAEEGKTTTDEPADEKPADDK